MDLKKFLHKRRSPLMPVVALNYATFSLKLLVSNRDLGCEPVIGSKCDQAIKNL